MNQVSKKEIEFVEALQRAAGTESQLIIAEKKYLHFTLVALS